MMCLQCVLMMCLQCVFMMCFQCVFMMCLQCVLMMCLQCVLMMCLHDVSPVCLQCVFMIEKCCHIMTYFIILSVIYNHLILNRLDQNSSLCVEEKQIFIQIQISHLHQCFCKMCDSYSCFVRTMVINR